MTFALQVIIAFLAWFATDVCWAFYVNKVKDGDQFKSAVWAVFLFLTAAAGTISYVSNAWLLIPAALGAFSGTYFAVWWEKTRK
jgi:hypothetical protein